MALAGDEHRMPGATWPTLGALAWTVFLASLLMLGPFLSRSRQVLREFALLAGVSTVAASLTLLLATWGLHLLAALGLALALSLGLYSLARPWVLGQLTGPGAPSAERMFDSLYRAARALEQSPGEAERQLGSLLRELFDPLELARSQRQATRVRVASDGAALVVPMPWPAGSPGAGPGETGALVLRHARQGRRLFTQADAQLCERLLEQLRRAVAHDHAVEHGRTEERARIAQDLHDDIGARLLTLMYRAPNAEIEEYIRHTLQDLKTLTRGLAASDQQLSHAAAEWKADITQRLEAAGCSLQWSFSTDRDLRLTAVQWSGLTRVLRELVNNIITHAQASQVEIRLQHEGDHLVAEGRDAHRLGHRRAVLQRPDRAAGARIEQVGDADGRGQCHCPDQHVNGPSAGQAELAQGQRGHAQDAVVLAQEFHVGHGVVQRQAPADGGQRQVVARHAAVSTPPAAAPPAPPGRGRQTVPATATRPAWSTGRPRCRRRRPRRRPGRSWSGRPHRSTAPGRARRWHTGRCS